MLKILKILIIKNLKKEQMKINLNIRKIIKIDRIMIIKIIKIMKVTNKRIIKIKIIRIMNINIKEETIKIDQINMVIENTNNKIINHNIKLIEIDNKGLNIIDMKTLIMINNLTNIMVIIIEMKIMQELKIIIGKEIIIINKQQINIRIIRIEKDNIKRMIILKMIIKIKDKKNLGNKILNITSRILNKSITSKGINFN